jgi:hypothetical protein
MPISYGASIVKDGLVLYLDAANPKSYPGSGTNWADLSGNGNDATLINGATYSGGSLYFDGIDDHLDFNQMHTLSRAGGTLEFIINRDASLYRTFLTKSQGSFESHLEFDIAKTRTETVNNCNTFDSPTFTFTNSQWNVLSLKFYANKSYWYINGIYIGETPSYGTVNCTAVVATQLEDNFNFRYLGLASAYTTGYQGFVSSLKLYNRALTDDEVLQNFEAHRGRFGI